MTTTPVAAPAVRRPGRVPLPALAGVGALAAFAGAAVLFADPLGGAGSPAEAAAALEGSAVGPAAVLLGGYAVLASAVAAGLAARLGRERDGAAVRLLPVLGAAHVLLLAAAFVALAAAVTVGTQVFDGAVTPGATEAALVLTNAAHPLSAWVGVGFLAAVAVAAHRTSRALAVVSAVLAVGLALPPVGWAVTYLLPLWFAGVGLWLWRRP
ncbi:hypothetical protein ACI797_19405 [Geodermatophilus sp. SYSU D00691]